jgi:hypothetical protein
VILNPDLFAPNESILMRRPAEGSCPGLAAMTWLGDPPLGVREGRLACLHAAVEALSRGLPELELWLLVGQRWQTDTVMGRHRGLWKLLESRGIALPSSERRQEHLERSPEGIRFFGTARLTVADIDGAFDVMSASALALLIAAPHEAPPTIQQYLVVGWEGAPADADYWRNMACVAVQRGGALLRPFGEFDDREFGVDVILERRSFDELRVVVERAS